MYMASIWEIYGRYMGDIWELYGFNSQFLQPTYMGLTRDIYETYKGHISHSHISLISPT